MDRLLPCSEHGHWRARSNGSRKGRERIRAADLVLALWIAHVSALSVAPRGEAQRHHWHVGNTLGIKPIGFHEQHRYVYSAALYARSDARTSHCGKLTDTSRAARRRCGGGVARYWSEKRGRSSRRWSKRHRPATREHAIGRHGVSRQAGDGRGCR
jgi:hypothetical protein